MKEIEIFDGSDVIASAYSMDLERFIDDGGEEKDWNREDVSPYFLADILVDTFSNVMDDVEFAVKKKNISEFIITGTVGVWYGRNEIVPLLVDDVKDAVDKCLGECETDNIKISIVEGSIEVIVPHHDGTNVFSIKLVSDSEWKKAMENNDDEEDKAVKDILHNNLYVKDFDPYEC